jgi:hypothetical protein
MAQTFKNYNDMLTEFETVDVIHEAIFALVVVRIAHSKFVQNFYLNICVIHIEFFIFAQFCSDNSLIGIFVVEALYHLTKCTLVNDAHNLVPIGYLLTYFG